MTHACCPSCRLRFTSVAAAHLDICPACASQMQPMDAATIVGFRLVARDDTVDLWPQAQAAALPVHDPSQTWS